MKVLKKPIIRIAAAALALCVAGTTIYLNTNKTPKIVEYKLPDYFEITEYSTIGFNGAEFIELAFLSSAEEFLDYSDNENNDAFDEADENHEQENNGDNDDENTNDEQNDSEDINSDIGLSGETETPADGEPSDEGEYPETSAEESSAEPEYTDDTDYDTTYPADQDINLFEINEFDMLVKYNGTDEKVIIPESVKEIAGHSFEGNEYIRCIVLHTTIEALLFDAFIGCPNLTEIYYEGSAEEWEDVYKAPDVIPEYVYVVTEQAEETTTEEDTTAPVDETTAAEDTTAPVDETTAAEETTATVDETTAAEDTTAPVDETTAAEDTTAPVDETTVAEETTAPIDETTAAEETTAPVDETTAAEEMTAPVDETTAAEDTTAPVDETTAAEETTAPVDEITAEEDTTEPEKPAENKTISLVTKLNGISGIKTKLAARMSYFPTSSVVTITNTDGAAAFAESALQLLDSEVLTYYAFDISVFDAETSEKIHKLNGDVKFTIGVPDILANAGNIKVYHINSGYPDILESEIVTNDDDVRMIEFSASEFSPFVFTAEKEETEITTAEETDIPDTTEEPYETTDIPDAPDEDAADSKENSADTITPEVANDEPIIKVTFPASTSYIINPYHLDVKVNENESSNASIISPEMKITSESNCKVAVYMSAVAQNVPDTVRLSDTYLTKGETKKSLFMYVEAADENGTYRNYFDNFANQLIVSQNNVCSQKVMELDKPEEGAVTEGRFKIFGETYTPSGTSWQTYETVSILMLFNVEAVSD